MALVRVDQDSSYLNLTLPPLLVHLPPRERGLASRIAAGTLQHLNTIDWALSLFIKSPLDKLTPRIRSLLRLSAYQLLYLDRVPAHAAVDEAVRLALRYGHRGVAGLTNAVLRRLAAQKEDLPWPNKQTRPAEALALGCSHPLWMVRRWINAYGLHEAEDLCRANNEPAPVSLRPNTLRTGAPQLKALLKAAGVEAVHNPVVPGLLAVNLQQSLAELDSFRKGLFTVQGESSALVAPLVAPVAGQKVLDLCSAPGGKTTHLAELMQDSGAVLAADLHPHRLRLVEEAARRLGLSSIRTLAADGREIGQVGLGLQDRILVDAPCSGLGVLRRLPELKWRRGEEQLPKMHKLQLDLLEAASLLLSAGGTLVYSICSNESEETSAVVAAFSAIHPEMVLQSEFAELPAALAGAVTSAGAINLLPHRHRVDGFFIARWIRRR
jgi:16S rRNA (cytosine967-C5)-methyltransferase